MLPVKFVNTSNITLQSARRTLLMPISIVNHSRRQIPERNEENESLTGGATYYTYYVIAVEQNGETYTYDNIE